MNLEDIVLDLMRKVFGTDKVTTDSSQKNCEQWDSLRHLTLASELENELEIDFEPEEIAEMTDFSKVVDMVKSKL